MSDDGVGEALADFDGYAGDRDTDVVAEHDAWGVEDDDSSR